jgi:hypothetical protein
VLAVPGWVVLLVGIQLSAGLHVGNVHVRWRYACARPVVWLKRARLTWTGPDAVCRQCPAGSYCPTTSTPPIACTLGV